MTTPTGTIKFSDITAEFGSSPNKKLGEYRVSQAVAGRNWPLDDGVPSSGTIRFSDLRGKTLNIVVDYSSESTRVNSGTTYDNSGSVIGGFKARPSRGDSAQTKKVRNVIRATLGVSSSQSITDVALRTGTWSPSTILQYIITTSGKIYGRGGLGGGGNGQNGSPALGIENSCQIFIEADQSGNKGEIRGGGGGGGQGGNYSFNQPGFLGIGGFGCSASGGAGGTGRGYNNQNGSLLGSGGGNCRGGQSSCSNCTGQSIGSGAGAGGTGGDWGSNACPGCNAGSSGPIGDESESIGGGSAGGSGGEAIIKTSSGLSVSITNNGSNNISGSTNAVGSFT